MTIEIAAGSQAFYGFPTEPVSTSNAGGKCVTAGETAPENVRPYTPGPWRYRAGLNGEFTISCESFGFAPLARVKGDKRSTLKAARANARLMAAAPELLAAVQALMLNCYDPDRNDAVAQAFDLGRDALAKAEGFA